MQMMKWLGLWGQLHVWSVGFFAESSVLWTAKCLCGMSGGPAGYSVRW